MPDEIKRIGERAHSIARQIVQTPTDDRWRLYAEIERLLRSRSQNFQATHFLIAKMRELDPSSVQLSQEK
jgi:hypothetical protein